MKLNILLPLLTLHAFIEPSQPYNILTIDGGGIRGIITANSLKLMEKYAYEYAVSKGYKDKLPKYKVVYDPKTGKSNGYEGNQIHMQDLFDMFAGTSTGSILASALSLAYNKNIPEERQPRFWATAIEDIYYNDREKIFKQNRIGWLAQTIAYFIAIGLFTGSFYFVGRRKYDDPQKQQAFQEILNFLRNMKENLVDTKKENHNFFQVDGNTDWMGVAL